MRIRSLNDKLRRAATQIWVLEHRVKELENALKFYADKGNHLGAPMGYELTTAIEMDSGLKARKVLDDPEYKPLKGRRWIEGKNEQE